jgi:hypothetical protein
MNAMLHRVIPFERQIISMSKFRKRHPFRDPATIQLHLPPILPVSKDEGQYDYLQMNPASSPASKVVELLRGLSPGMSSKLGISKADGRVYKMDVESYIPLSLEHELPLQPLPRPPYRTSHTWSRFCTALQADENVDRNAGIPILGRLDGRYSTSRIHTDNASNYIHQT